MALNGKAAQLHRLHRLDRPMNGEWLSYLGPRLNERTWDLRSNQWIEVYPNEAQGRGRRSTVKVTASPSRVHPMC